MSDPNTVGGYGPGEIDAIIDAYLDREMGHADVERFESRLRGDPVLRGRVERAREIESATRRLFAIPLAAPEIPAASLGLAKRGRPARAPRPRWLPWGAGIAALLALAAGIQYGPAVWRGAFGPSAPAFVRGDALACFKQLEDLGFRPEWVCKDDAELARFTREQFGHPWSIAPADGLTLIGWTYSGMLFNDNYARVLLAEYRGKRLAVVIHDSRFDRAITTPADHSFFAHRACFGDLVAYELSPLPEPVVLGRIAVAK